MTRLSLHVYVCTIVLSSSLVALLAEDKPELCDDGKVCSLCTIEV